MKAETHPSPAEEAAEITVRQFESDLPSGVCFDKDEYPEAHKHRVSSVTNAINNALTAERAEAAEIKGRHDAMAVWISLAFGTGTHCTAMQLGLLGKKGNLIPEITEAAERYNQKQKEVEG